MAVETKIELIKDPLALVQDGMRYPTGRWVVTTRDIREVPGHGRVDFGQAYMGPTVALRPEPVDAEPAPPRKAWWRSLWPR